jgi:hypothetical protein
LSPTGCRKERRWPVRASQFLVYEAYVSLSAIRYPLSAASRRRDADTLRAES